MLMTKTGRRAFMRSTIKYAAFIMALTIAAPAFAAYPDKPIKFIVPWPPGGSSDSASRIVAAELEKRLGQPIIIENRTGGAGNIGASATLQAPADGYTIMLSSGPFSINPSLFKSLPFDTVRDFRPVAQFAVTPSVLVVHPSFPAKTVKEFVSVIKARDKSTSYASPGNGTAQHLAMELLKKQAGLYLDQVPYRGGAPAITDVLAGHVTIMLAGIPEVITHIKAGNLRALAVTTAKRTELLPDVPSLMEVGLADAELVGWNGVHVRAGTPTEIINRLNTEIRAALKVPEVRQKLNDLGFEIRDTSVEDFSKFFATQMAKYKEAVEISGAQVD